MKERDSEPLERTEAEVRHPIESPDFQTRHPGAYARWSEAEAALWKATTISQFTDIGHGCRETIQLFVTDLIERHRPASVEPDPQKTVSRLRAVLDRIPDRHIGVITRVSANRVRRSHTDSRNCAQPSSSSRRKSRTSTQPGCRRQSATPMFSRC